MPISLGGITLPPDIQWTDEFAGFGVGQTIAPTITGALLVEEFEQTEGRPITLASNGASWVERSTVVSLEALAATPLDDEYLTLVWGDGREFEVVFDRSSGNGFRADELRRLAADKQGPSHKYLIEINLLIKDQIT
tara:strand:- start:105 stop:512 length:408 start_codon:yes stop_codon:yes gene_type:complete